ncbi:hypothetical protein EJB05_39480 [Eragrostis curvula]|uniref:Bet v I/Major latex protein domain-containing protein n=1 Tax=Eragrostis curvula TaxID=38414 RepID=A0A5J9TX57_9POAL|nr:hypothetical protein EJB05_39480 [Eragrostis curvula]
MPIYTHSLMAVKGRQTQSRIFLRKRKHKTEFRRKTEGAAMKGSKSHELETDVPAPELWAIYGTLRAAQLVPEVLPHVFTKCEVLSGDGGVGTILKLTFSQGGTGTEKFVKVDNENYVKEAAAIDGDVLNAGFLSYMIRFEVIGKGPGSSVIRSTVEYEFDDARSELEAMVSTAPLAAVAEGFVKYVKEQKTPQANN